MTPDTVLLDELVRLADNAGAAIVDVYRSPAVVQHKEDGSPVTEADRRADRLIREGLQACWPDLPVVSEESSPDLPVEPGGTFFLVDPLDGTREFVSRSGEFTVNIALVHEGRPVAGVVSAPALDVTYFAAENLGAWRRDRTGTRRIQVRTRERGEPLLIVGSRSHARERLEAWLRTLSSPHEFTAAGSSLKFCRIAEGTADLYPRLGSTCWWDTAAAQCVLEQAGGQVTDLAGKRLLYGSGTGRLNPEFVAWAQPACYDMCTSLRQPTRADAPRG